MKNSGAVKKWPIWLAPLLASLIFGSPAAMAKTASDEVKASVGAFISAKDNDTLSPQSKEVKKFAAARETLRKILDLSIAEVERLKEKLDNLKIEELVASDYSLDAAEVYDMLSRLLDYYLVYYADMEKRVDGLKTYEETRVAARDLKEWRGKTYLPGVERLVAIDLVLRNKSILRTAGSRLDKILNDLRKLKNSKLISLETLNELVANAGNNLKSAAALDEEATNVLIKLLKTSSLNLEPQEQKDAAFEAVYRRIVDLTDQSLIRIKNGYRYFFEINIRVKKMVGVE